MFSCLDNRWKLGDFFDPIIRDEMEDNKTTEKIKSKLNFLSKAQNITNACDII